MTNKQRTTLSWACWILAAAACAVAILERGNGLTVILVPVVLTLAGVWFRAGRGQG